VLFLCIILLLCYAYALFFITTLGFFGASAYAYSDSDGDQIGKQWTSSSTDGYELYYQDCVCEDQQPQNVPCEEENNPTNPTYPDQASPASATQRSIHPSQVVVITSPKLCLTQSSPASYPGSGAKTTPDQTSPSSTYPSSDKNSNGYHSVSSGGDNYACPSSCSNNPYPNSGFTPSANNLLLRIKYKNSF
ncbi:hypothetical protein O181_113418, partial [Austropuccinia psidii MF-1]|nr:hypothetical protein [Austropuccinia psidii MF-1]